MNRQQESLEPIVRRMGQPSWLILAVLDPAKPLPGTEIIDRVEDLLARADYPLQTLDPSTLHYALKRMMEDGLVAHQGRREVDVPGPHGSKRRAHRDVYVITGLGEQVLEHKRRLDSVANAAILAPAAVGGA